MLSYQAPATPEGYTWVYIGACPCGGQDLDCAKDDRQWRMVPVDSNPERKNNGCMIYGGEKNNGE